MANHYSKYIDFEDPEFSNGQLCIAMFYIKDQIFFECDEKLALALGLIRANSLMKMTVLYTFDLKNAVALANLKPEYRKYYRRTILLAPNSAQKAQSPI